MQRLLFSMLSWTNFTMAWPVSPSREAVGSSMIKNVGLPDHSPGDGHALLFASAEFHGRKILSPLQANNFQVLGRFLNGFVPILFS